MNLKKSYISLVLLCTLIFSFVGGIDIANATELTDELKSDCICILDDCENATDECECPCDTCFSGDALSAVPPMLGIPPVIGGLTPQVPGSHEENDNDTPEVFEAFTSMSSRVYTLSEQLLIRLYRDVHGRPYDAGGLAFWEDQLKRGLRTGGNVAFEFFFSPEFLSQNHSNGIFLDKLYTALMGRTPDGGGRAYWLNLLNAGLPREDVFAGFVNSPEFDGICRAAGIVRGTYHPPRGGMARMFVTRIYDRTLNRPPDIAGLNFWHTSLVNGTRTGAVIAYEFMFSPEMHERDLNDTRFLEILYEAMMGRASDSGGRNFWLGRLSNGESRYSVFVQFVNSPEFNQICRTYGIVRGTAPQPRNLMPGSSNLTKVWNRMIMAHFRGISERPEHIAGIIGNLQSEAGPQLCPFQIQVSNHVGLGLMQWSFGRRTALEDFMWRNGISSDEFFVEMNRHADRYCTNPGIHPTALHDRVLAVQVDFMFHELRNTSERIYLNYVNFPTDRTGAAGARAYAELFCSLALRPGPDSRESGNILDLGVINALRASPYLNINNTPGTASRISFHNLALRRDRAETVYQQFLRSHN